MSFDVLSYMLPNELWRLENHFVAASSQPIITAVLGNQIWYMKGTAGYPWDMFTFDESYVYQSVTENVWTDPKTFKIFASKSWPKGNGGIVWCPRYMDDSTVLPIQTGDSTYRIYTNCSTFTPATLGGPIQTSCKRVSMVVSGPWGSTPQDCLVVDYQWNPGFGMLERNVYVLDYGLVSWTLYELQNGLYVQNQQTLFNTLVAAPTPAVVFPCGVPTIS